MIGVDISDHSIKIIRLDMRKSFPYVTHGFAELPDGAIHGGVILQPETVRKVIKDALKRCGITGKNIAPFIFSLPETRSFLRVIEIPNMQEDEISEAIKWEVAQHIPLGLENMYLDWQPIAGGSHVAGSEKQEIQVGAAQRKLVDSLYEALHPLGLDVAAFELESQAIVRSLISAELRDKQGIVIVDVGGTATNVIVHDHGAMRFTATLGKGLDDMLPGDHLKAEPQLFLPVTDELASEVLSIVEFYNSIDAKHVVREIILTGGGSNLPSLDTAFLKHFDNVHVQRGNPWVNVLGSQQTKTPMDIKESVRFATALGLAMRPVLV